MKCTCSACSDEIGDNHAHGCCMRNGPDAEVATYFYIDINGNRYHVFGGPPESYAKGFGPIQSITKEEFMKVIG